MAAKEFPLKKLEKYEEILLREKEQAQKIIHSIDEIQKRGVKDQSGDLSSYSVHQADLGTDTDEAEKRVYLLNKELEKLKNINQALRRIYDKTYGICEICGNLISEKRLKIVPYARFCIECKSKEELKQRKRR
ncbi:MAG TPA: TraR/DksA C4-type zinc finger protein [Candidatus Cloacimonadota bacterium]|nr:TraR/DksA C4-type zinc finger protein [Candidatus Cloacimonadota bacterium]